SFQSIIAHGCARSCGLDLRESNTRSLPLVGPGKVDARCVATPHRWRRGTLEPDLAIRPRGLRRRLLLRATGRRGWRPGSGHVVAVREPGTERLGATDPARHAEGAELRERGVDERPCALAIACGVTPGVHERLVVVDDRTQWAGALLVKDR